MNGRQKRCPHRPGTRRAAALLLCITTGFALGISLAQLRPDIASGFADCCRQAIPQRAPWMKVQNARHAQPSDERAIPDAAARAAGDGPIQVFFVRQDGRSHNPDAALLSLLQGARQHIVCAFYDFELDGVADTLIEKHREGVPVGIVSDTDYAHRPAVNACLHAGIRVVFDQRSALMHNKFCVVDGRHVWTGSTNITANCLYRNDNNGVWIVSPELAANFTAEFEEMHVQGRFGAGSPRNTPHPALSVSGIMVECYFAPEDGVQHAIVRQVNAARQRIDFMAFSFTSKPIASAMSGRMHHGVRVRGMLESRNAGSAHSRHLYLGEHGAEIHLDGRARTMHHKVIVVDARTVMTGSYNFSESAEKRNDENLILIHDTKIAQTFIEELDRLIRDDH